MYRGSSRGPCIGTIYPTLLGFGGIQAIILSYIYYFAGCKQTLCYICILICMLELFVWKATIYGWWFILIPVTARCPVRMEKIHLEVLPLD